MRIRELLHKAHMKHDYQNKMAEWYDRKKKKIGKNRRKKDRLGDRMNFEKPNRRDYNDR